VRIEARHIVEAGEPRTGREEGPEEGPEGEHHNLIVAAEHRMAAGRPEEDTGCYSAEDNTLVGEEDYFQEVLPGHRRHNHRSSLETADIGRPEGGRQLHFEVDTPGLGDTGLE
jgi:hypothetical protein